MSAFLAAVRPVGCRWLPLLICLVMPGLLSAQAPKSEPGGIPPLKISHQVNVVYGQVHGAGLLADIAYPESGGPFPAIISAIISVHGGRWRGGHKRDASTIKVEQWAGFGFFAMSIDYRLTGCTPAPACYRDFQCAIRYVHAHAGQYRVDPDRNDNSVPVANALLMVEALKKAGADLTFHHYPDKGHMGITDEVIEKARKFIKEKSP